MVFNSCFNGSCCDIFSGHYEIFMYILTLVMLDYNGSVVLGGAASKPFCFLHVCSRTSRASIKSHHLQFAGVVEHPILGNHCVGVQRLGVHLIVIVPRHKHLNKWWSTDGMMMLMTTMMTTLTTTLMTTLKTTMTTMVTMVVTLTVTMTVTMILTGLPG